MIEELSDINYVVRSQEQWLWLMEYLGEKGIKWRSGAKPTDNINLFREEDFNPTFVTLYREDNKITWGHSPELYNFNQEEVSELMEYEQSVTKEIEDQLRWFFVEEEDDECETVPFEDVLEELGIDLESSYVYVDFRAKLYEDVKEYVFQADDFELDKELGRYIIINDGEVIASISEDYVATIMYVEHEDIYQFIDEDNEEEDIEEGW